MSEAGAIPFSWRRALIYWPVIPNIYLICGVGSVVVQVVLQDSGRVADHWADHSQRPPEPGCTAEYRLAVDNANPLGCPEPPLLEVESKLRDEAVFAF